MTTIRLYCHHGATTKMLVSKMDAYAKSNGYECDIQAFPYTSLVESVKGADAILLAPQVRFKMDSLTKEYPDKAVIVIEAADYGMMEAGKILEYALNKIKEKE